MKNNFWTQMEKVRARPEAHRQQITFGVTVLITALIVIIWVGTLGSKLGNVHTSRQSGIEPVSLLKQSLEGAVSSAQSGIDEFHNVFNKTN